jgi:PAS domain-containing protein
VRDYTVRYRIIRPSDGETRWISVKSTIERDEQGRAIRLVGAHTDVTEQVMAEQAPAAKRRAIPQACGPALRAECDAGAARRGKDPGARPDLERVAGSSGGRGSRRRLANSQPGMHQNARLERS